MSIYILGTKNDNELILDSVLECVHECFDKVFRKVIERKSLINNMTAVILIVDELLDNGTVMTLDKDIILQRIKMKKHSSHGEGHSSSSQAQEEPGSQGAYSFASVFASAKSQF